MKFLCDRCKTRYSIGDDRVRGKILKIRCKNCANVITVREGMADADADAGADRRGRPTTAAPLANVLRSGTPSALGSAFASQMSKPPPALEEEWYVSIDGEQSGPFSLAEAQRWIAAKAFDVELHCWSEGFDDWLPVDKVSHFRGLRKRPVAPAAPPPLPRVGSGRAAAPVEDPKPLFAATMASLERATAPDVFGGPGGVGTAGTAGPMPGLPTKPTPAPAGRSGPTANGSAMTPALAKAPAKAPALPSSIPSVGPSVGGSSGSAGSAAGKRPATVPGLGGSPSAGANALAAAFSARPGEDLADSMTAIDQVPFIDEHLTSPTSPEPIAAKRAHDRSESLGDNVTTPNGARLESAAAAHTPRLASPTGFEPPARDGSVDDGLDIGEVSRVVKLADLMAPKRTQRGPAGRATGAATAIGRSTAGAAAIGRNTGPMQKLPIGELGLSMPPPISPTGIPQTGEAGESLVIPAPVATHRRGMIILIAVAAVLLLGVIGAVVMIVSSNNDSDVAMGLGHTTQIDTSRPEDQVRHSATDPTTAAGSPKDPVKQPSGRHWIGTSNPNLTAKTGSNAPETALDPTKLSRKPDEVEDMFRKQQGGIDRCYIRAQKGAEALQIGDVKKITVTLSIDKDGAVTDVTLSDHGGDSLGKCLGQRVKGMKFGPAQGAGSFQIVLAAPAG